MIQSLEKVRRNEILNTAKAMGLDCANFLD